jgi:hypothetical protein
MAYTPKISAEKAYYDYLWDVANNRPTGGDPSVELSGLAAVNFFQRSGVDKGFLKQIWSMSTPSATMNSYQFYTALRFITMIQNGEIPISPGLQALSPLSVRSFLIKILHRTIVENIYR